MQPLFLKEAQALAALFRFSGQCQCDWKPFYDGSDDWEAVEKIRQALEDAYLAGYERG